jgi:hypothetical protein
MRVNQAFPMICESFSPNRPGVVHFIVLSVALAACVDLTPPWGRHEDASRGDASAEQAGAWGSQEAGQFDAGATDQALATDGADVALVGQDGQDSSGTSMVPDTNTNTSRDASTGAEEVGQLDSGAPDQAPPADTKSDIDTITDIGPTTVADTNSNTSWDASAGVKEAGQADSGAPDQAPPADTSDAALGQDGRDSSGAYSDTNADTNTGSGIIADGTYRVIPRHSGKALDVYGKFSADGSNVDQWTYDGGNNQLWTLTHLGENVYKILGVQTNKALEVATTSTADGTNVDIRTYTGAANQQWTISPLSGGYFRLTPVSSSGSALDVTDLSTADGANVCQYTWTGGNNFNQQWSFQSP